MLRRTAPPVADLIEVGDLTIDRLARVVSVRGDTVHLAGKEFELLSALADEPHRVFTTTPEVSFVLTVEMTR